MLRRFLFLWLMTSLLAACGQGEGGATPPPGETRPFPLSRSAGASPTPTEIMITPMPRATVPPTPGPTATLPPTPTPTAPPLTVSGDPRAGQLAPPAPSGNAPCGVVDVFDFPLDPPDGEAVSGGRDFGVFRGRFDKYHAGEDWWWGRSTSFGKPVYSIGHGLVTYAEPEGWNRDKGVVIVQHTLADGRSILSFYGHLDPPTVTLEPGQCVERGAYVGDIGRPRSSPHLHFEVRTQSPYTPLTGYWPDDPTLVGWLPPSQTIWEQRLAASAGVMWTRPSPTESRVGIGVWQDALLLLEDGEAASVGVRDGRERWRFGGETDFAAGALDESRGVLYLLDRAGEAAALSLPDAVNPPTVMWRQEVDAGFGAGLLPLPEGGVLIASRRQMTALAADGHQLWTRSDIGEPFAWDRSGGGLLLSTTGGSASLWFVEGGEATAWRGAGNGFPLAAGGGDWLVGRDGVYRLAAGEWTAVLHKPLPTGALSRGDGVTLPDGGLLIAHADSDDRRLLAFYGDGRLRWERSYEGQIAGEVRLLVTGGEVYVVAQDAAGANSNLDVYVLNMSSGDLRHIFRGGSRSLRPAETWLLAADGVLLLNIGGGHLAALDGAAASQASP